MTAPTATETESNSWKNNRQSWQLMEFNVPISEFKETKEGTDSSFMIHGTAISETTTHNNHKYIAEELNKAAPSMIGKPLLVDHDNRVESIKGRVIDALFDNTSKSIKFQAQIMDSTIKEMIRDKRISNVSIGAFAEDLIHEEETGAYIAKGIKIVELSLVAVPADENATFAMAMNASVKIKESYDNQINGSTNERRSNRMTEEKLSEATILENKKLKEEVEALRNERKQNLIAEYKKLCSEKKVKDKDVSNVAEETIKLLIEQVREIQVISEKRELKSEISEESNLYEGLENVAVERLPNGKYGMFMIPDKKKLSELHKKFSIWNGPKAI